MAIFPRLQSIDWAAMHHAYGSANDVPELIEGLVSASAETRESSLDGMYGAVHHQGDIYDSTVASIPFLFEALSRVELPGRAEILGLLSSIGSVAVSVLGRSGVDTHRKDVPRALAALRENQKQLLEAIADADVGVRRVAPGALDCCEVRGAVVSKLLAEFEIESDLEARRQQAEALTRFIEQPAERKRWLTSIAQTDRDPLLRLQAFISLLEGQTVLDDHVLDEATRMVHTLYGVHSAPMAPPGAGTDTLIGHLRQLAVNEASGRKAPDAGRHVHRLSDALGDHVDGRITLLVGLLRSSNREMHQDALGPLSVLIGNWRGDYRGAAVALGAHLVHGHPRTVPRAAAGLAGMFELATPAADALVESLHVSKREGPAKFGTAGPPPWVVVYGSGERCCGDSLKSLARIHDARTLPMLEWVLEQPILPKDIGFVIDDLGAAARPLSEQVAARFVALAADEPDSEAILGLIRAVRVLELRAAHVADALLLLVPHALRYVATSALDALGELAAASQVPRVAELVSHQDRDIALAAASALARLAPDEWVAQRLAAMTSESGAITALSGMGPVAKAHLPAIRAQASKSALEVATALWRLDGDAPGALRLLKPLWQEHRYSRERIGNVLVEMGTAAEPMREEVHAELRAIRRHNFSDKGSGSHQVFNDESLLRACRRASSALTK